MNNNSLILGTLSGSPTLFQTSKFTSSRDVYYGKQRLSEEQISEIWGNLPQTGNEEHDAVVFGMAIQEKLFELNK